MNTINSISTAITPVVVTGTPRSTRAQSVYTTTQAQLEIWLSSQQSVEANCAYNEISSLHFEGELDVDHLKLAIDKVFHRNASLRSTFSEDGRTVHVHPSLKYGFELLDWSGESHLDLQSAFRSVIEKEGQEPFDLVNGPLVRFVLQKVSGNQFKLTFSAHHIVLDGWSLAVFCRDLGYYYDLLSRKGPKPLPSAVQYNEYAEAMGAYAESQQRREDESYWKEMFQDSIPVLDLPTQSRRAKLRTYTGRRYDHHLSAGLVKKIRKVATSCGCSLFNGMLSAFNSYLARLCNVDDFCVGIPAAGQAAMEMPELIGHCVNTMPLRARVDTSLAFNEYMKSTRTDLLDAFDHQRLSFGELLRLLAPPRDPSRPPMVSVSFNVDPMIDCSDLGFDGLDVTTVIEPRAYENFEWFLNGVILQDQSIEMQVQYNADLFTEEAMAFYLEGFEAFLTAIADSPSTAISDYPLMSVEQRHQVVVDWNQTEMPYPIESTLHQEFTRQAVETPDKVAIEFDGRSLTYREVELRSNQAARFLQQHGVGAGDLVGICVERSEQMLVNLYAIMKAGAGYVPLDPAYPTDRLQYMCDHSGLKLVLTESRLTERASEFDKPLLAIDDQKAQIDQCDAAVLKTTVSPEDICYVIYTSGSTGKPKGVQVPHGAVVNFLYSMQQEPGFTADDSLLAVTTLSFDIAVLELYLPTVSGGKVVLMDSVSAADGALLSKAMVQHDISLLQATPATWRLLLQSGWEGKQDLKILCGGEPMPQDLVGPLLDRCGELWNMYGPTETTVWSAVYRIQEESAPILIGKPIGNTQIYLLDSEGKEVPVGCEGELLIGGAGVTLGYRNRDDLTADRFIKNRYRNPFVDYVSDRLYKTGDIAKYRFDGNIEFLRRNDKQVKVRGFRIELGEIESNLKSHPAIEQNVVIVREDTPGDVRLVAYLIVKQGADVSQSDLRTHLRESVPHYMVPQHFVVLDAMPQTNNGKIDYKQLPKPAAESSQETAANDAGLEPGTEAEEYLAGIWKEHLEHDDVFVDDTFFDIGGHSLLVMQVISVVEDKTGVRLGPQDFLVNTLGQLASKIESSDCFAEPQASGRRIPDAGPSTPMLDDVARAPKPVSQEKGFWD